MGMPTRFEVSSFNAPGDQVPTTVLENLCLPEALEVVSRWMTTADIDVQRLRETHPDVDVTICICVGVTRG
jgi:hypothetical protein